MCACWHDRFWIASWHHKTCQGASASILTYWDPWPAQRLVIVVIAQISRVLHGEAVLPLIYFACRNHTQHRLHTNGSTQSLPPSVTRLSWCWYGLEKRLATTRDNIEMKKDFTFSDKWSVLSVDIARICWFFTPGKRMAIGSFCWELSWQDDQLQRAEANSGTKQQL